MKKLILSFLFAILIGLTFNSCSSDYNFYDENANQEVATNVKNVFGVQFPSTQDWVTTINSSVNVHVNGLENVKKVQILMSTVTDSLNTLKVLNQANVSDGETKSFTFDIPNNYTNLFVAFINNDGEYVYKKFNVNDKDVYFNDASLTRGTIIVSNNYRVPDTNPVIDGTIETYANERGWLPGEVFYSVDYHSMEAEDYDDAFKSVFRSVIFNYFPNGRKYDNLPQIKKSGYYNESVYPITTGKDPIIVSPIYKNDGGYHEIAESELYYYYYKGNKVPTVAEIEAMPKYKAIKLDDVFTNEGNNEINKSTSYVLAYFGDGVQEVGKEGSYQFPKGYKIGFCYKSNSTADKGKKKGETYGDGRLNYNINSYGNFATAKLGPTEPRMAWMTVNKKMFLCVESGTDRDFNDLICEVEGGIEQIIIIPDDPEFNFYTFCYEDRRLGDYDMNDVVLKGERLDETHVKYTLMACGAHDELYIHNIEGDNINSDNEVHSIFGVTRKTFVNTEKDATSIPFVSDIIEVDENFSFLDASTQPYLYDKTQDWEVKISRRGEDPHAIMIPYEFRWPLEKICIKDAYLRFNEWGINLVTSTDWYVFPEEELVY